MSPEERPYVIDPPKGFVALANNKFIGYGSKDNLAWNSVPTARGIRLHNALSNIISSVHLYY